MAGDRPENWKTVSALNSTESIAWCMDTPTNRPIIGPGGCFFLIPALLQEWAFFGKPTIGILHINSDLKGEILEI